MTSGQAARTSLKINLRQAARLDVWFDDYFTDLEYPASNRCRVAGACLVSALHHHRAIYILTRASLPSSAFALVRVIWQAYINGIWLVECASEDFVDHLCAGTREMPKVQTMVTQLEEKEPYRTHRVLSRIHYKQAGAFNSYTHMGTLQLQRWNTPGGIEPNFSLEESEEVLGFSAMMGLFAAMGLAVLTNDDKRAERASRRFAALVRP